MLLRLATGAAALAGLVAGMPAAEPDPQRTCQTRCVDGLNKCGVRWGGCYDVCKPHLSPTAPPCVVTSPPVPTKSPPPVDNCSTRTVCADYVNACGQKYGGCFADCKPWPTFKPPPCTKTTITTPPPKPTTTSPDNCSTRTVCADYINECGQMYGGCFPDCKPWPTFKPPPCTKTTITTPPPKPTTTTSPDNCSTRTVCADYINECGQMYGGCFPDCKPWPTFKPPPCTKTTITTPPPKPTTTSTDNCSTRTVCADYINECGQMYGGCFPDCKPWPTFTPPPCTKTTTMTTPPPKPTTTTSKDDCKTRSICVDYINSCGMMYGGCFADCKPWPTFNPPSCPTKTTKPALAVPT